MFKDDSRAEAFLHSLGVKYKYMPAVPFSELEKDWDQKNIGRPVVMREEAVLSYATRMTNGQKAPAVILHLTDKGYEVLDGVQRLGAAQLNNCKHVAAYVVVTDSEDLLMSIRVLANTVMQGVAESDEWNRRRAVEVLVVGRGMEPERVARLGGWRVPDVIRLAESMIWSARIASVGGPADFPDTVITVLAKHMAADDLLKATRPVVEFLTDVRKAQLSAADAEPYIEEFFKPITKGSRAYEIYEERLEAFRKDPEIDTRLAGRRSSGASKDVTLRRLLRSANTVADTMLESGEPVLYVDEFFRLLNLLDTKLHTVAKNQRGTKRK